MASEGTAALHDVHDIFLSLNLQGNFFWKEFLFLFFSPIAKVEKDHEHHEGVVKK